MLLQLVMRYVRCLLGAIMTVAYGSYICVSAVLFSQGTNQVAHEGYSATSLSVCNIVYFVFSVVWLITTPLHAIFLWNGTPKRKLALWPLIGGVTMLIAAICSASGTSIAEHHVNSGPEDMNAQYALCLVLLGFVVQLLDLSLPPYKYLPKL